MIGTTYFLIIGVEKYIDSTFSKVLYANKDAKEIKLAFINLGYSEMEMIHLEGNAATKSTIESNLELIVRKTLPQDRIILFFAGHGISVGDRNMLVPVDANSALLERTCISIEHILGVLKKAESKRNILFIDCCHSGFEPGELERHGISAFNNDRLMLDYRNEEYCIGFASCQAHQVSISDHSLQHGVWTSFLIKALKGETLEIYEEGCLFSSKLQEYLRDSTSEFVKLNSKPRKDQIPVQFGYHTKRFIIEDLSSLLASIAASKISKDFRVESVSFSQEYSELIKNHPKFIKGKFFVPTEFKNTHNDFIKKISEDIIEADISEMSSKIKESFGYKLKQVKIGKSLGYGAIITPDFDYEIEISQSSHTPSQYSVTRFASEFKNTSVLESKEFNKVFGYMFSNLIFRLNNHIDIEALINSIESLPKESVLSVEYNHNDLSNCTIIAAGIDNSIVVDNDSLCIVSEFRTSPQKLLESFIQVSRILISRDIGLLLE